MHALGLGLRRTLTHLAIAVSQVWLSAFTDSVSALITEIFAAQNQTRTCPCQRFDLMPYGRARMTRGQRGLLLLRCVTLSFTTPCRFLTGRTGKLSR
jgi:hypothetical protein